MNAQKIKSKLWIYLCKSLVTDIRGILGDHLLTGCWAEQWRLQRGVTHLYSASKLRLSDLSVFYQEIYLNGTKNWTTCQITRRHRALHSHKQYWHGCSGDFSTMRGQKMAKNNEINWIIFPYSVKFFWRTQHYNCGERWVIFPGSTED